MSPTTGTGTGTGTGKPDRNLALELVRVTEAAAMAAGRWVGRGDKNDADGVEVGDGTGPECDVAVDPIDGTTLTATRW